MQQYHYVYKITNLLDGKIYIGKHSTSKIDDEYMGSGLLLNRAIKKYGVENFKKEIIQFFDTSEEAFECEKDLVTEDFVMSNETYNMTTGGNGSWHSCNRFDDPKTIENRRKAGSISLKNRWQDPERRKKMIEQIAERNRQQFKEGRRKAPDWTGKTHQEETKEKIGKANAISQLGEKNSQYGTCWIHSLEEKISKKIKKEELEQWLSQGWIKGRKFNF
jgi:hypothetical protein